MRLASRLVPLVTAALALGLASSALGATISTSSGNVTYSPAPGETNTIVVSGTGTTVTLTDAANFILASGTCTASAGTATCTAVTGLVAVNPSDLDDTVDASGLNRSLNAADSNGNNQSMTGGSASDILTVGGEVTVTGTGNGGDDIVQVVSGSSTSSVTGNGGDGNDTLIGRGGTVRFSGGEGNDLVRPIPNSSDRYLVDGGLGFDRVTYQFLAENFNVSLDGLANDGVSGTSNIGTDVEAVSGSSGVNTLTGSTGPNVLAGFDGADTLNGGQGNDFMGGGQPVGETLSTADSDTMSGGGGADTVTYSYLPAGFGVRVNGALAMPDGFARGGLENEDGVSENDRLALDIERFNGSNNQDVLNVPATFGVTLVGFGNSDSLTGGGQNDFLDGGLDSEVNFLDCGGGNQDTFRIQGATAPSRNVNCENGI